MFTDTVIAPAYTGNAFFAPTFEQSPDQIALETYNQYRTFAEGLIDMSNPQLIYMPTSNAPGSRNGFGLHEKWIHFSRRVMDVSVGNLDFPWYSADHTEFNAVSAGDLLTIAMNEPNPLTASRIRQIYELTQTLPLHTRVYYYQGHDGTKAVTLVDEINLVKFAMLVSHLYV